MTPLTIDIYTTVKASQVMHGDIIDAGGRPILVEEVRLTGPPGGPLAVSLYGYRQDIDAQRREHVKADGEELVRVLPPPEARMAIWHRALEGIDSGADAWKEDEGVNFATADDVDLRPPWYVEDGYLHVLHGQATYYIVDVNVAPDPEPQDEPPI